MADIRMRAKMQLNELFILAIGAVLGALIRYLITSQERFMIGNLPVGVLTANIIGSVILGIFMTLVQLWGLDSKYVLFVAIGFCGSLTTMSSFAFETVNMLDSRQIVLAAINILTNVGFSILAILFGRIIASLLLRNLIW